MHDAMRDVRTLTGLRGYAALWVMLFHYTASIEGDGILLLIARQGTCGLTTFFVLSGFILAHVYHNQFAVRVSGASYRAFLWARIARVYPLHLVTLFAWLALVPRQPADTALTFALNLFLIQSWGLTNELSWNQPSWSISVEFFAYLLLPLVVRHLSGRGLFFSILGFTFACWAVITLPYSRLIMPLAHDLGLPTSGLIFLYGLSLAQWLFVFLLGVCIQPLAASLLQRCNREGMWDSIFLSGLGVFLLLCFDRSQVWLAPFAAVLVTFGLYSDRGLGARLCGNRVAVFFGEISYALYLTHYILLWLWPLYFGLPQAPLLAAKIPVALGLAAAVHFGFERPVRRWLRNKAGDAIGCPCPQARA